MSSKHQYTFQACPQAALDWLSIQVTRNKHAQTWLLKSLGKSIVKSFFVVLDSKSLSKLSQLCFH